MSNPAYRAYLASRVAHKNLRGVTVTVSRGINTSAPFTATIGFSGSTSYEADGSTLYTKNRDYLIEVALYNAGGEVLQPAKYDIITEVINGEVRTYQVIDNNGDGAAASADANLTVWRVHTKEI
jgi:hypothetical protein